MYKEKIVDVITGQETFRDYTPEEVAEVEAAIAAAEEKVLESKAIQAAKANLYEKLGITEEELKILLS